MVSQRNVFILFYWRITLLIRDCATPQAAEHANLVGIQESRRALRLVKAVDASVNSGVSGSKKGTVKSCQCQELCSCPYYHVSGV